jgi:hypothetical protein
MGVPPGLDELWAVTPGQGGYTGANERVWSRLLADYVQHKGRLVPCVGAGLSAAVYPTWGQALADIAALAPHTAATSLKNEVRRLMAEGRPDEAASILLAGTDKLVGTGKAAFIDTFAAVFDPARATEAAFRGQPVALLPEVFGDSLVLTTNFDCVLERAVYTGPLAFADNDIVRGPVQFTQSRQDLIRGGRHMLLKIHGCVTRPHEVVFTAADYDWFYGEKNDSANAAFLDQVFRAHPVLFLGCSLVNDRTTAILSAIAQVDDLPHYALLPRPDDPHKYALDGARLADAGIRPIWYPAGQHAYVSVVLQALLEARPADWSAAPSTTPPQIDPLDSVGRDTVAAAIYREVSDPRRSGPIEVHGGPGIGKSTVCRVVLNHCRRLGRPVHEAALSQLRTKTTALSAIVAACGGDPADASSRDADAAAPRAAGPDLALERQLADLAAQHPESVLNLDNTEDPQRDPAFTAWLTGFARSTPWRVVYSTQTSIRHPDIRRHHLGPLDERDAAVLFCRRWGVMVPDRDQPALTELVQAACCHPLSLVIAAAQRDRWQTVPDLLTAWRARADSFTLADADPRHRSVFIAVSLAHERLRDDDAAILLWAVLALVPRSLPAQIADLVPGLQDLDPNHDPVSALLRHGLAEPEPGDGGTAYSMLNPIKEQVFRLHSEPLRHQAIDQLSSAYMATFDHAQPKPGADTSPWQRLAFSVTLDAVALLGLALRHRPEAVPTSRGPCRTFSGPRPKPALRRSTQSPTTEPGPPNSRPTSTSSEVRLAYSPTGSTPPATTTSRPPPCTTKSAQERAGQPASSRWPSATIRRATRSRPQDGVRTAPWPTERSNRVGRPRGRTPCCS